MRVSVSSCSLLLVAAAAMLLLLLPAVQMQADAFSVYVPAKDEQVSDSSGTGSRGGLAHEAHSRWLRLQAISLSASHCLSIALPLRVCCCVFVPQCFFEEVSKGEKVVGSYWVAEGGNLDVDLRVLGPDGKIVYERERTQDGSFQFKAQAEGETDSTHDDERRRGKAKRAAASWMVPPL